MLDTPEPFDAAKLLALMQEHAQRNAVILPEGVIEALNLAYQVSIHVEEGRPLRVAFALTRPGQQLKSELFLKPPVRKFEELRRLAPAAGREWLCVRFGQDADGEWSVLSVAPRQEIPDTIWRDRFWGRIVFVECPDPGCVALKVNDHEVRYERGRYVTYDPLGSVRSILPPFVREAMVAPLLAPFADRHRELPPFVLVDERAYADHFAAYEQMVRAAAADAATDGAYFLAEYTNRLRHGGTVLIAESPQVLLRDASLASARHILTWITSPDERWNAPMLEMLEWESHRRLAETGVTVLAGLSEEYQGAEGLQQWIKEPCRGRLDGCMRRWYAVAHRCAELTQTDGVTVFDRLLNPVAVGVKILNVTDETVDKLPKKFREAAIGRGLRHQSAACVVAASRGSLALVVSQDGHVTAFAHNTDGTLNYSAIM